jgi:hypothetical protein
LEGLLETNGAARAGPVDQLPRSENRLSQWFNGGWANCFYGYWRRC